jgi:hypothetical protein
MTPPGITATSPGLIVRSSAPIRSRFRPRNERPFQPRPRPNDSSVIEAAERPVLKALAGCAAFVDVGFSGGGQHNRVGEALRDQHGEPANAFRDWHASSEFAEINSELAEIRARDQHGLAHDHAALTHPSHSEHRG